MLSSTEIGPRLRAFREARGKSLAVIAGLAGISKSYLQRLETGDRALDRLSLIGALADALRIAPSELIGLPIPAPSNGDTEQTQDAVRHTLLEISTGHYTGVVLPAGALRQQVEMLVNALCQCKEDQVGRDLPSLIRNLHASIAAGQDVPELLELAVFLHTQATVAWLRFAGAPVDLCSQAATLARRAAEERDTKNALGLATASTARVMIMVGALDIADRELASIDVPTDTSEGMQLAGFRALRMANVAAAAKRPGDMDAPLNFAAELAGRTGEQNAYSLSFGPTNVGLFRMAALLETGDHEAAVALAESLQPEKSDPSTQAYFWADYARGLARLKGRREDAAQAFLKSEGLFAKRLHRDPFARGVIAELVARTKEDAVGPPLRGLAYRAGLEHAF